MNTIDLALAAFLAYGTYKGYKMGVAVILINTIALFVAVIVAIRFLDVATQKLGEQIQTNHLLLPILAFGLLFGLVFFGLRWFAVFTSKSIRYTMLGAVDQVAGGILGLFRMAFMLSSLLFGLQMLGVKMQPAQSEMMYIFPALMQLGPASFHLVSPLLPFLKKFI